MRTRAQTSLQVRVFGSREAYRQSFSSIATNRDSETLTKLQRVPTDELGIIAQASRALPHVLTIALGLDLRDLRADDDETTVSTGVTTSTSARQRETGGYADAVWQPRNWMLSGSIRVDSFRTFHARQATLELNNHHATARDRRTIRQPSPRPRALPASWFWVHSHGLPRFSRPDYE